MGNMKLSVRLTGGFLIVAAITLVVGFVGWSGVSSTDKALEEVAQVRLPSVLGLGIVNEAQTAIQRCERVLVYEQDQNVAAEQLSQLAEAWQRADKGWKIYEPLPQTTEEARLWKEFVPSWDEWKRLHQEVVQTARRGDLEAARALSYGKARDAFKESEKLLGEIVDLNVNVAGEFTQKALPQADRAKMMALTGMAIGALAALALGIGLSRSITGPISRVVAGMTEGADQVASASSQVSSSSQSLAQGASEQAAGLQEASSSIEEITSMTRQNADNAEQANHLMGETIRVVDQAAGSMDELTTSMEQVSLASGQTAKIIKTIDEIAFQTNLLALNAAVEAARAGEAGAGFAVVADEVRNLAMRAAEAAKNTATMIEDTIRKIGVGSETVVRANEAFRRVADGSKKVGQLVGEIAAASQEQSRGIAQVNTAVGEMDKVVQQNAANAEESASASEELNAQAEHMKGFVEELAALVGGSDTAALAGPARRHAGPRPDMALTPALSRPALSRKPVAARMPVKKTAAGNKTPAPAENTLSPDQMIPLDATDF